MVKKNRTITNAVNSWRVCIDHHEDGVPKGRIYHMLLNSPVSFTGWMSLIKQLNSISDYNDFPQESMQLRKIQDKIKDEKEQKSKKLIQVSKECLHGEIATFRIRILFRQNATWQGIVYWVEREREEHFRSVLELMTLMDSCWSYENNRVYDSNKESTVSAI